MRLLNMILCTIIVITVSIIKIVVSQHPTPCPDVFTYKPKEKDGDRWFGEIHYQLKTNLTGVTLHVILDRPADLLGNWLGPVTSTDNTVFIIEEPKHSLEAGLTLLIRIFVKFSLASPIPSLKSIKLNDKVICPTETGGPIKDSSSEVEFIDEGSTHQQTKNFEVSSPWKLEPIGINAAECGVASFLVPLIYRGEEASPGRWPWHAALYHFNGPKIQYSCGATLITAQHLVTAAHCVVIRSQNEVRDPSQIIIKLGLHDLQNPSGAQTISVSKIFVHDKFDVSKLYNDIAVLKLSSPVEVNDLVKPCCLWDGSINLDSIVGERGTVVGWGINEKQSFKLMQTTMPVVSFQTCFDSHDAFRTFLYKNNYCAGDRTVSAACSGDSGGGMVFSKKGSNGQTIWRLRGIVSLSLGISDRELCETSNYDVFTDVAKYIPWIEAKANE